MIVRFITLLALAAATSGYAEEQIVLGALYNSTGPQAGLDVPSSRGARLAVAEANANGGVLGRSLVLDIRNGESKAGVVKTQATELLALDPAPVALFGLSDTDLVLTAAPIAAADKRLFLTSGATSPLLPAEVPEYLFLACFGDNVQAAAAAEWAYNEQRARTAVVLFDSTQTYTRLLKGYFKTRFVQLGGSIAAEHGFASDMLDPALVDLPKADIVFFSGEEPSNIRKGVSKLREAGVTCPILGGDSFDSYGLWNNAPKVDKVYYTTHAYLGADNRAPKVVAFRKAFQAAYPDSVPDAFAALGYDAARLLIHAIEQAKSDDPTTIRKALAATRNFDGVTGTISYSAGSRIPKKPVTLIRVAGGKLELVGEFTPQQVPSP